MNFNLKKHRTLITIFVLLVIFGLIMTYVPFLFYKTEPEIGPTSSRPPQTASLTPPPAVVTSSESVSPQGFSGLNEEDQSLDKIENLLNNQNQ